MYGCDAGSIILQKGRSINCGSKTARGERMDWTPIEIVKACVVVFAVIMSVCIAIDLFGNY